MASPTLMSFVEATESVLSVGPTGSAGGGPDDGAISDQLRFVADLAQYCRRNVFVKRSKGRSTAAADVDEAWRSVGRYLTDSVGCFDVAEMAHFVRNVQAVSEMPLRASRRVLDTALLHRLRVFYESYDDETTRASALRDLITISAASKTAWLEQVTLFETALNRDPAGVYPQMDAQSKEAYRNRVETLATQLGVNESEVVACALRLSQCAAHSPFDHVGYYLLDQGVKTLCSDLNQAERVNTNQRGWTAIAGYLALQACLACIAVTAIAWGVGATVNVSSIAYLCLVAVVCADSLKPSVELLLRRASSGRPSLAVNFDDSGLPESCTVLIAVPIHLVSIKQWNRALETARWNLMQANDTNVALVFLSDFPDSKEKDDTQAERDLLMYVLASLRNLSPSIAGRAVAIHLLHRDRELIPAENCWMGKERKRGKLDLLNRLLVHGEDGFSYASDCARSICGSAKYVLCLDEDARLTRSALQRMAGFLDHPLNQPRLADGRIQSGHGLAVPCTMTDEASLATWRWPRFSVGPSVSARCKFGASRNFMYDWFAQAPYSGKGMYSPKTFEALCAGRIPDGIVLSHDTIEAAWLCPGYVDKALVTDAYPAAFRSFIERQDRWVRGDLQNAAILTRRLLSPSERPPALTYFTVAGQLHAWTSNASVFAVFALLVVLDMPLGWYAGAFLAMMLGGYQRLSMNAHRDRENMKAQVYVPYFFRIHLAQLVRLAASPLYALVLLRATLLTGFRLATQRNLLQWRSAAIADADQEYFNLFAILAGTVSATAVAMLLAKLHDGAEFAALSVLGLWSLCALLNRLLTRSA